MSPDNERRLGRILTRRNILILGSVGIAATLAGLNCARPERPEDSVSQTPTDNPPAATQRVTESPKPAETPNTIEQRVKTAGLTIWKDLLTTRQEDQKANTYLDITITNLSDMAKVYEQVLTPGAKPTTTPIKASWRYLLFNGPTLGGIWGGKKWIGEVEFDNISIQAIGAPPTDAASRANGIEWQGRVSLKFIQRTHSSYERATTTLSPKPSYNQWVTSSAPHEGFSQLSDWRNDDWGFSLTIRNGQVQRGLSRGAEGGFEVPSSVFQVCDTFYPSCRAIDLNFK